MRWTERDGLQWLEFAIFDSSPGFGHASLTRKGGFSPPPYDSLNFSVSVGDSKENVIRNRLIVQKVLNLKRLVTLQQCHGTHIALIEKEQEGVILSCDGAILIYPGCAVMITHADCQPVLVYDPVHHVGAALHAGWRGLTQGMLERGVRRLSELCGSCPEELLVAIGPSLGAGAEFKNYRVEFPEAFWPFREGTCYFDLHRISRWQLEECGVQAANIEISPLATDREPELFFSFRRASAAKEATGRGGTFCWLR